MQSPHDATPTARPARPVRTVRTVVTAGTPAAPVRTREAQDSSAHRDRLSWWIGGGMLTAGALTAAVTAAVKKARRPKPAPVLTLVNPDGLGAGLATLAATAAALGIARAARRNRDERQGYDAAHEEAALMALVPAHTEPDVEDEEGVLLEEEPMETVPVPLEALVLIETLLDPALSEGRALPGVAELTAQLPHVRTLAAARPALDGGADEDGIGMDWMPLVVDPEIDLDRAVPHDFTWPVRGRFTVDGHDFQLVLVVIDGELGALAASPADEAGVDWDALPVLQSWPGVGELTFEVDGERR